MSKDSKDPMGDRMKEYERQWSLLLNNEDPIIIRVDGRAFHTVTGNLERPFDEDFRYCMQNVVRTLIDELNPCVAYMQSDEVSILMPPVEDEQYRLFGRKHSKLVSISAAVATSAFQKAWNYIWATELSPQVTPIFDARVFQVPCPREAVNAIMWREFDAIKNSVNAVAHFALGSKAIEGKTMEERKQMLRDSPHHKNWEAYPEYLQRGTYARRMRVREKFTLRERMALPEKHHAHQNPDMEFERSQIVFYTLPPLATLANPVEVLFNGAEPQTKVNE